MPVLFMLCFVVLTIIWIFFEIKYIILKILFNYQFKFIIFQFIVVEKIFHYNMTVPQTLAIYPLVCLLKGLLMEI